MTNAQRLKKYRANAVARGLCYVCRHRFPRPGVRTCDECLGRTNRAQSKGRGLESRLRRGAAQRARRTAKRIAAGLCPRCGRRPPVEGYRACSVCLDKVAAGVKAIARARGAKPDGRCCSECGSPDHFAGRHRRPGVLP